jgi:hypothetical protein
MTVLAILGFEVFHDVMSNGEAITAIRFHTDGGAVDAPMPAADAHRLGLQLATSGRERHPGP